MTRNDQGKTMTDGETHTYPDTTQRAVYFAARDAGHCVTCPYSLICTAHGRVSKVTLVKALIEERGIGLRKALDYANNTMVCRVDET